MMTAFAVIAMSMSELLETSRIVPVDAESCFDSERGDEKTEAEWESAEKHFHEAGAVSSVFWVESPNFVPKMSR